jgi:hypothetical protein
MRTSVQGHSVQRQLPFWILIAALLIGMFIPTFDVRQGHAQSNEPTRNGQSSQATDYLTWAYPQGIEAYQDAPFVPGEILVGYHGDPVAAAGLHAQLGLQVVDSMDLRGLNGSTDDAGVAGYVMSVPDGSEWALIERLLQDPSVAFATPNWTIRAAGISALENESTASIETPFEVNDTFYAERQWYAQRINASRAWQLATSLHEGGSRPIRVAVIDSGVDFDHVDLKPHLLPGWNYLAPGSPPIDDYGHGTHIAGVVAATLNNASGISGLSPWAEIEPYKVLDNNGNGGALDVSNAIKDAADSGADVINLSLQTNSDSGLIRDAVNYAASRNVLMVAAAGNPGNRPVMYPGAYDVVMAVASTEYDDERSSTSAVGKEVEIAAPGGGIFSTWPAAIRCSSDFQQEDGSVYCSISGTSMAASVISGVAALVWGLDPSMPAEMVRDLLKRTATPLAQDAIYVGSGRVDALAAVRELVPMALEPSVTEVRHAVTSESERFTSTVEISNPSSERITWTAELALDSPWVQIAGEPALDTVPTLAQAVSYGSPGYVSLIFSPDQAPPGLHVNSLVLRGKGKDFTTIEVVPIALGIDTDFLQVYYFPRILQAEVVESGVGDKGTLDDDTAGENTLANSTGFQWEIPADESDRIRYMMTDDTPWRVSLPFVFPYGEDKFTHVYLHSDGALTMPYNNTSPPPLSTNGCLLTDTQWPASGIYGWWADLDPSQPGAVVSGFAVGSDRYVFEFSNVPSAGSVSPGYVVSFQMVLYIDGDVQFNYRDVPSLLDRPPLATVGLESTEGRFRNQVFCADGTTTLRIAPGIRQSFRFTEKDIY